MASVSAHTGWEVIPAIQHFVLWVTDVEILRLRYDETLVSGRKLSLV